MKFINKQSIWLLAVYFLLVFFSCTSAEVLTAPTGPYASEKPVVPSAPAKPELKEVVAQKTITRQIDKQSHEARWNPIHFKPAIDKSTNKQCLECHADILQDKVLEKSPAGIKANETLAWYQTLETYEGEQQTFHQRHLTSKEATTLMDLKCSTCHQGHDPSTEISYLVQSGQVDQPIRKLVKPDICHMCHGGFDPKTMPGLAGPWAEVRDQFNNDCVVCHNIFRTERHQVNFLNPEAIEKEGLKNGDSCYGCHGGRAWYQKGYPYPRHPWSGMVEEESPEWAKNRPIESEARFLVGVTKKKFVPLSKEEPVKTQDEKEE